VEPANGARPGSRPGAPWRAAALGLALVLATCGGPSTPSHSSGLRICIATNAEGLARHSFNQLAADGARTAGGQVQVIASHTASDYLANIQRCIANHADLVVAVSQDMASAVASVAKLHATQRFALVDGIPVDEGGKRLDLDNVSDLLFKAQEPGYLVGAMAGLLEKNKVGSAAHNVLGILGSNHGPAVDSYIAGYIAGAKSVNPGLTWKITYSDSQDTAFCKQLGITQISAGADILFEVTGRCASGYIDAAYDASAYAIGSDNDDAYLSPAVITSALKRVDRAVAITVQRLQHGQFKSGQQLFTTQDDATGFSSPSSVVPQDVINQVLDIRARIRSGALTPPDTIPPGV
jgi:basic membrane protein A and related proteins